MAHLVWVDLGLGRWQMESRVRYGAGGAGFHSPGPAVTRGRGDIFRVIPAPSPVSRHLFFTGAPLGNGRDGGQGQGTPKITRPAPGRSAGNGAGGPHFSGPRRPRNER